MSARPKLLVVYHSQSGRTQRLADAVLAGASQDHDTDTVLAHAPDVGVAELIACDAVIFGTPENFGTMSGMLKDFFDRTYDAAREAIHNTPYAVFVSAGNDGTGAVRDIARIARGYPLKPVAEPVIVRGEPEAADLEKCRELGLTLAAGLSLGIF